MIALRESLPTHARTSAAHLFQAVRFFTNRCKEVDPHVSAAQQTDGLLAALATVCVGALRFWMIFVGVDDVAVRLLAGSPSVLGTVCLRELWFAFVRIELLSARTCANRPFFLRASDCAHIISHEICSANFTRARIVRTSCGAQSFARRRARENNRARDISSNKFARVLRLGACKYAVLRLVVLGKGSLLVHARVVSWRTRRLREPYWSDRENAKSTLDV